jgi:hypothetical protein
MLVQFFYEFASENAIKYKTKTKNIYLEYIVVAYRHVFKTIRPVYTSILLF